jgi:hypothetical protein
MRLEVAISLSASIRAGTPDGLWAEIDGLLPAGWTARRGLNEVDFIVDYPWTEQSIVDLSNLCSTFSYGFFSLIERRSTARCRLVSLMKPGVGFVMTFNATGHPWPARPFDAEIRFIE